MCLFHGHGIVQFSRTLTSIQDFFQPNSWQTPVAAVTVYSAPDDGPKGVRNMYSIRVVITKYNRARVASCWFIIYYRICSDRTWGKYECGTILQLIHFAVFSCIYRICSDRTWGKYEYRTVLQFIIQLIYFTVCSSIYRVFSDST